MSGKLMPEIFDNSKIAEEIHRFCMDFPECRQAKESADTWLDKLMQMLGYEEYCAFEDAITKYYGLQAQAHYLFGLRLRRELCAALFTGSC